MDLNYTRQIRSNIFLKVLSHLEEQGCSPEQICDLANIDYDQLKLLRLDLTEEQSDYFWYYAAQLSGISDIGFQVGCIYSIEMIGLLGMILQNSATIGEAVEYACGFASIATPLLTPITHTDDIHTIIEFGPQKATNIYNAERNQQICIYSLGMIHQTYSILTHEGRY